jgi:hypothetical protein
MNNSQSHYTMLIESYSTRTSEQAGEVGKEDLPEASHDLEEHSRGSKVRYLRLGHKSMPMNRQLVGDWRTRTTSGPALPLSCDSTPTSTGYRSRLLTGHERPSCGVAQRRESTYSRLGTGSCVFFSNPVLLIELQPDATLPGLSSRGDHTHREP